MHCYLFVRSQDRGRVPIEDIESACGGTKYCNSVTIAGHCEYREAYFVRTDQPLSADDYRALFELIEDGAAN